MTVTFGGVSMAGAEDDIADGPLDLHGSSMGIVQEDNIVGADYPQRIARGNRVYEFTFRVKKKHASYEAAITYWITHLQAFAGIATVTFTQGGASLALENSNVIVDGFPNGATTEWTYQVRGVNT